MSSVTVESIPAVDNDWLTVCLQEDLVPGSGVCVLFENKQVALFYVGKPLSLYAIANYDPFSQANVLSRGIVGSLKDQLVVASPIFKQHFNLQSGDCLEDDTISVDVFPARIQGNHVQMLHES
jgi:nitrite reductase (NADH) small subunit